MQSNPPASSESTRRRMQRQRRKDTAPELELRSELHGRGLRYRLHQRIIPGTRREVDIVFKRQLVAIEVYSCFWHLCPEHGSLPKSNTEWWYDKLTRNRLRDADTASRLASLGWHLIVVWEHDDVVAMADSIEASVRGG